MKIKFKRDTSFRKQFFVPDSFAHPAKMDAQLLIWIVEHYSKAGETILDPMAGSGTTMLACTLGRHCLLIELEEKFCKMMRDNWELVKMRPQLGSTMGDCQIIQGDARQLEGLPVDKCIFSPPFADQPQPSRTNHGILNHKPDCKCNFCRKNRGNKGAIQGYRQVDKIVTSPPYAEMMQTPAHSKDDEFGQAIDRQYSKDPNNIGNFPYGEMDKCIFSPPYGDDVAPSDINRPKETHHHAYGQNNSQIGNLPYGQIDKIVTSPPYEGVVKERGADNYAIIEEKRLDMSRAYSDSPGQIGGLKSQSYLEAMLQVYQQCYKVLKPQGLMILVTKNF